MASVTLQGVGKVWPDGTTAVEAMDLEIADGEMVVLVGPSGCGKSTTLRMIAGLEEASSGTIAIDGGVVNEVAARERDIAMVFQSYALYPHLSVRENLLFGLARRSEHKSRLRRLVSPEYRSRALDEDRENDRRVREVAAQLGLVEHLEKKPGELSGGQRQRVALGRAIVREPKVFLFDEPLSNLDAKLRLETRTELKALHKQLGATMIYVTHDQEEAMTLGDRLVVMHAGVVQQCAPPTEVYARPANRFVAGFVGTPPMNFLEAAVGDDASSIEAAGERIAWPRADETRRLGAGARATIGLRPDGLRMGSPGGEGFEATVELVEHLGDRVDVVLRLARGARLLARVPAADAPREGEARSVSFDPLTAHLFDASGDAIRA